MRRACVAGVLYGIPFVTILLSQTAAAHPAGTVNSNFIWKVEPDNTLYELAERFCGHAGRRTILAKLNAAANPLGLPLGSSPRILLSSIPALPARGEVVRTVCDLDLQEQADVGELHEGNTRLIAAEQRDSLPVGPSSSLPPFSTLI